MTIHILLIHPIDSLYTVEPVKDTVHVLVIERIFGTKDS